MNNVTITKIQNFDLKKAYIIKGMSMHPFLQTGDILIVDEQSPLKLKKGDIVAFIAGDSETVIVHRLLKIKQTKDGLKLITKGDNNINYDNELKTDEYVGRGTYLLRGNRTINLESPFQKLFSRFLALLSIKNFNIRSFKLNPLVGRLKENTIVVNLISKIYSSDYQCVTYPIPDSGQKLIRAFCKKKCFAHGILESNNSNLQLINWSISFPFYHTDHGKNFLISLVNYARENSMCYLTIKNLYKNNPVRILLNSKNILNSSNEPDRDFAIDIKALRADFACNNGKF